MSVASGDCADAHIGSIPRGPWKCYQHLVLVGQAICVGPGHAFRREIAEYALQFATANDYNVWNIVIDFKRE
jgi:hypothetical protein